jgi:2-iminobutanoate/2-iminopropanoate deaminase
MKKSINVKKAAPPIGPFSHAVIANGFVFVSGQGPMNPETEKVPKDFKEQVAQTLKNLEIILQGVGANLTDVVKVQVYLANLSSFPIFNEVYQEFFPSNQPARTTVGAELLMNISVEIDCIALLSGSQMN